jgi:antitoxin component of MazEF toxin-antitoxin module
LSLKESSVVDLGLENNETILRPTTSKYTLEELLAKMRPERNCSELLTEEIGTEKLE